MTSFIRLREFGYRLVNNERGVVSFEYVIVAFCIVTAVAFVFGTDTATGIGGALTKGLKAVTDTFAVATTPKGP